MNDKHEGLLDEYLKIASDDYLKEVEAENDRLMDEYKDIDYPKSLDTWFEKVMDKKRKKYNRNKRLHTLYLVAKRSAAVFLVLIIAGSIAVFSVDALRVEFMNLFINQTDQYDEYSLSSDELMEYVEADSLKYYPRYIPVGFKLNEYNHDNFETTMEFINGAKSFNVNVSYEKTEIRLDNENAEKNTLSINGKAATLLQYDNKIRIIIKVDKAIITVSGNLEKEEIIKISEKLF